MLVWIFIWHYQQVKMCTCELQKRSLKAGDMEELKLTEVNDNASIIIPQGSSIWVKQQQMNTLSHICSEIISSNSHKSWCRYHTAFNKVPAEELCFTPKGTVTQWFLNLFCHALLQRPNTWPWHTFYQMLSMIQEGTNETGSKQNISEIKVSVIASANSCLFSLHKSFSFSFVLLHIYPTPYCSGSMISSGGSL